MATGVEIRAEIDGENAKGLLLINGGGAVALLAFLPTVIVKPEYHSLTKSILCALLLFQVGLLTAVIHNRLRRVCSLKYDEVKASSPAHPDPCSSLWPGLEKPCVCIRSDLFLWVSVLMFFVAGLVVFAGGIQVVWTQAEQENVKTEAIKIAPNTAPQSTPESGAAGL